jgi:hypothetical protein
MLSAEMRENLIIIECSGTNIEVRKMKIVRITITIFIELLFFSFLRFIHSPTAGRCKFQFSGYLKGFVQTCQLQLKSSIYGRMLNTSRHGEIVGRKLV